LKTIFLLMAQYDAQVIVPIETVCRDFFAPLTLPNLRRKIAAGNIALPLIRMEAGSQKTAQGVHLQDLANYIDARRAAAVKECQQLNGSWDSVDGRDCGGPPSQRVERDVIKLPNAGGNAIEQGSVPVSGERLIRIREVLEAVGVGRTLLYAMIHEKEFPPPRKVRGMSLWLNSEVQAWIRSVAETISTR
jgi:predicted DNA-binding transcriptional regulator AlpA